MIGYFYPIMISWAITICQSLYSAKDPTMDMSYEDHSEYSGNVNYIHIYLNWIPYLMGTYKEAIESENDLHDLKTLQIEWKKNFDCCDKGLQYKIQQNW